MDSYELFRAALRIVRGCFPNECCESIQINMRRGVIKLQPPLMGLSDGEIPAVASGGELMPIPRKFHPIQFAILKALAGGKSMKGEALIDAAKIGGKGDLFRRGHGINELREMGLAGHEGGVGYFLTERGEEVAAGL